MQNKRSQCDIFFGAFCMPVATLAYKNHLQKCACYGRYEPSVLVVISQLRNEKLIV